MAAYSIPTGPFTGSYTVPATSSNKPSVTDRVSDTARGTSTAFGVSTGVGGYIPGGIQAAQDAAAKQIQDAWNSANQQASAVVNQAYQGLSYQNPQVGAPSKGTDPLYQGPSYQDPQRTPVSPGSYNTTSVGGDGWVTNPGSTSSGTPGSVHAQLGKDTTGSGNTGSGNTPTQQQGSTWPGYQENYPQYVNPFGNDAQVQALNDYYNQLKNAWTGWAEQAKNALEQNAVQLATTPGGMEAAQAAIEKQLSDALAQLKSNVNSAATQIINNVSGDTTTNNFPDINMPGITLPGTGTPVTTTPASDTDAGDTSGIGSNPPAPYTLPEIPGPNPERVDHVNTEPLQQMLKQITDSQKEQSENRINYTVQRGIDELNRAMEDAAKNYQTQRNQVSADEARALDNQALYAEARGDRGGIGEAQYDAIQNTAAQNRRAVNDAQVKLGTDTARQVADLRAQGEFEKADQLLSITQSYMSQLANLEQWALGTNVGVDEFNSQLQQWVDEYNLDKQKFLSDLDLSAAQLTGMFSDGTRTYEAEKALITSLANSGNALLQMGIMPSQQQLQAMGMTASQAQQYVAKKTSPLGQLGLI